MREILKGQLDDPDLSWEEKGHIFDLIMDTPRQESVKDSENKQFLKEIAKYALTAVGSAVLLGVVYVGGKVCLEQLTGDNDGAP